jgi:hypothetical protein
MSIAALNALYATASAALDAEDYSAAITAAVKAQALLGTTPNLTRSLGSGSQGITWNDGASIERFIANCRKLQKAAAVASGGPFRSSKITYQRATQSDSY